MFCKMIVTRLFVVSFITLASLTCCHCTSNSTSHIKHIGRSINHRTAAQPQSTINSNSKSTAITTIGSSSSSNGAVINSKSSESNYKNSNKTSHEILSQLGMARLHVNPSHHRKRLAVQSRRHHSRPDDSDMFVIKLPPSQYYYAHNAPHRNRITGDKKVPVGFRSNGKPARIYHWNIPVLKKMMGGPKRHASRSEDSPTFDIRHTPTWTNWENEVTMNEPSSMHYGRKKTPSYYAPAKPNNKKKSFMKMFPGNGKPRTFYVIEKSKKKTPHQMLLP